MFLQKYTCVETQNRTACGSTFVITLKILDNTSRVNN